MPQQIGVIGGSFNPVHIGHLRMAEEAIELLSLDSILFIPAAVPPHKSNKQIIDIEHRWEMLSLAVKDNPRFRISDLERRVSGKAFTVDTLCKLHEIIPEETVIYFLLGLDAFLELDTWWHFKELFELAHMVVLRRPGYDERRVNSFLTERISSLYRWDAQDDIYRHPSLLSVRCLRNTHIGISSTMIRQLVAGGRSVRYLVPYEVMVYIEGKSLYKGDEVTKR